jgi:hypothetical protein
MGLSVTSTTIYSIAADFLLSTLFPGNANVPSSTNVSSTHWIARQTVPLHTPYSAAMLSIVRYSLKYFKVTHNLFSGVSLGGFPPFLCIALNSFCRTDSILLNVAGFTPYSRLKVCALSL